GEAAAINYGTGNPYQYTGRENDSDGLYYYRARYYNPMMKRFISEDPAGITDGLNNFYAYVGDSPLIYSDPYGLWALSLSVYDLVGGGINSPVPVGMLRQSHFQGA